MGYLRGEYIYGDNYINDYYIEELWIKISGFQDYYISNKGRVWSNKSNNFLKLKKMDDHGHLGVILYKNSKRYYKYIHRLVAEHFISNPYNFPIVRHLNDCPFDNEVENLAWGEQSDNINDCIKNGNNYIFTDEDRYKANINRMIPLIAIDMKTNEQMYFKSQRLASKILKIPQSNIWKVLKGYRHTAGGYIFKEVKYE